MRKSEDDIACERDLKLFGSSFRVDGKRVDPARVTIEHIGPFMVPSAKISADAKMTGGGQIIPTPDHCVPLTDAELDHLLTLLGLPQHDISLKPGAGGLTGEGALALRDKLVRFVRA